MLDSIVRDVRYAVRWLTRSPAFAAVAVLSLGLGVGVNTAMFSLVDTLLLRPLPVTEPKTLVDVFTSGGDTDAHATSSFPDFQDLKTRNTVFSEMTGYSMMMAAVSLGDRSRLMFGQLVTSNHFQMLGVRPERGRLLVPDDDRPGAPRVVVLSHRMWIREFGGAADAVGRTLTIRGQAHEIVGIAPAAFTGVIPLLVPEMWLPITDIEDVEPVGNIDSVPGPGATALERRGYRWMFAKGRLKPGATASQAAANVRALGTQLAAEHATNTNRTMSAVPTNDVRLLVPEASGPLSAGGAGVMAVVGLVLLIACANVAGLLIARASARRREMSVRAAIGASRGRIVQQLLVEGTVIGLAGVVAAIAVAWALVRVLMSIELPLPLPLDVRLDARVLAFAVIAAAVSGLLASLTPAIRASSPSLIRDLRGPAAAANASGRRGWPLREWLVGGQVALTMVLLVVASLLLRSLSESQAANVGFNARGLALVSFDTDMVRYPAARGQQFWDNALARVQSLPSVESAAIASPRVPFDLNFSTNEFKVDGRTYGANQRGEILNVVAVSPGYFDTLGVAVTQGRDVSPGDRESTPPVAVVNETMARKYWPNEPAVGKFITVSATKKRYEIVGVSADYKVRSVMEGATPYVHFAAAQRPSTYNYLMARAKGDANAALADMRRELLAMEPGLVFVGNGTMERTFRTTLMPARVGAMLAAGFGVLGMALAAIGLYGVMAFTVVQRTREIGIRVALGAKPGGVLRMILRRAAVVVAAGAVIGLIVAALAARVLSGLLYGIGAADPVAWVAAIAVVTAVTALASAIPARRALRVDPARTLRAD